VRDLAGASATVAADHGFADHVLAWFDHHGRKDLPWQQDPSPYRVWVSEVMLQQTQVATVIPYFEIFMRRFPGVRDLAAAPLDEVLHHWSGLGYYARARNLHRAAGLIVERHAGEMPRTLAAVMALPGIGRSTAGAILALSRGERHPILDGNVKRVLARHFGIAGYAAEPAVAAQLWSVAERHTPFARVGAYTQAMMDLGATVCVRRRPRCQACPVAEGCVALATGRQHELPAARPRAVRRLKRLFMLLAVHDGRVLLERRPPSGIWGGLWGLPEFETIGDVREWCARTLRLDAAALLPGLRPLAALRHAFTHFDLDIEPLRLECGGAAGVMEPDRWVWYNPAAPAALGLAAPVRQLIDSLAAIAVEP
jgi:A/G-specific adenine glycosylase